MVKKHSILLYMGAVALSSAEIHHASAQDATLEEVVVTARKKEERLSDVPISISAVGRAQIEKNGLLNLEDMAPAVPNFTYSEAVSGNDQVFIRGLGSGVNPGFENAVGQVLDGFFFGRSRFGRSAFLDLERVEVLKGPQGALIGKNTTAGAINITTAKPTEDLEGFFRASYEFDADEGPSVEGAVSGGISESVRGRLAFKIDDRDGWVKNINSGVDAVEREDYSVRGILDIDVTDTIMASLFYQVGDSERIGRNREYMRCSPAAAAAMAGTLEDCKLNYRKASNRVENGIKKDERTDTEFHIGGLTLDWDLGFGSVTSLTGVSGYDSTDSWDGDQSPLHITNTDINENFDQWSQELRFASNGGGLFDFIGGLYYLHTEQDTFFGVDLLGPARRRILTTYQESDTLSAFAQLTWNISTSWDITGGLRYTTEEKEASQIQYPAASLTTIPLDPVPAAGPFTNVHNIDAKRDEKDLSPNIVVRWRPIEDVMFYASFSKGFKGGGFDHFMDAPQSSALNDFEFEEEEVDAVEVGAKITMADGAGQLNIAVFRSEFQDLQVSSLIPGDTVFKVGNAASAITQGVEADLTWLLNENLQVGLAGAYLDATYDRFENGPCYALQEVGCTVTATGRVQDLSGKSLQYAPDTTFTFNSEYTLPIAGEYDLSLFVQAIYTDDIQTATDNDSFTVQKGYTKVDATLSFGPQHNRWIVSLVGRNLTDRKTSNFINDVGPAAFEGSYFAFTESPRSISLQGTLRF